MDIFPLKLFQTVPLLDALTFINMKKKTKQNKTKNRISSIRNENQGSTLK